MKFKAFQFSILFLIMGVISILAPSTVFADAHEAESESGTRGRSNGR